MKYLTGIHALNLRCSLNTCGDWHCSALRWNDLDIKDTADSVFAAWGIEGPKNIPEHSEAFMVANHLRALLDLLDCGKFSVAQGMRDDFICDDSYTPIVFSQVMKLSSHNNWGRIDKFLEKEYKLEWLRFKEANNV